MAKQYWKKNSKNVYQIFIKKGILPKPSYTHPRFPIISPPVGKSGPGMYSSNSCSYNTPKLIRNFH